MTEVARFDRVLHWKDVGGGIPAEGLIVDFGEGAPPDAPRITPNFLWRLGAGQSRQRSEFPAASRPRGSSALQPLYSEVQGAMVYIDVLLTNSLLNIPKSPATSALWLDRASIENARPQGVGATLVPPDLPLPTATLGASLQPLVIDEGAAIPQAVIDAEDDLRAGATYPAAWNRTPTIRVSWTTASGNRIVRDLAVSQVYVLAAGTVNYPLVFELDIPRNQPDGSVSQERFDLLQLNGQVSIEALPVYWQDLQPGQTLEGAFTARKLFARRDDSQVENVEYDQTDDGATQVSIQRVTAFTCRQEAAPPLDTILSEHNLWDGSEGTWQVQSVELLDRGRTARLQCVEYTGS